MKRIVFLTGAGMSAESGITTFRDSGGLWENYDVMQVASIEGWYKNPALVQHFYNSRRTQLALAEPNEGHLLIASLEKDFNVSVVTQNVDDLHERAGSSNVIHLHGELVKACNESKTEVVNIGYRAINDGEKAGDGSILRPYIVWFGEAVPMIDHAAEIIADADIAVIIGTSMQVYPAAGLIHYLRKETPVYLIDPKDVPAPSSVIFIREKASEGMKKLKEILFMKHLFLLLITVICMTACSKERQAGVISLSVIEKTISELKESAVIEIDSVLLDKGVRQTAKLWQRQDGSEADFVRFCVENYIADPNEKERNFLRISEYLEVIAGNFNNMTLGLTRNMQLDTGPILGIDERFASYSPGIHLSDDLYANQLAFFITLNFPEYSLREKQALGEDRLAWAYARLGDMFTSRVPAEVQQAAAKALSDADAYVSAYNIHAGHLLNNSGERIFDEGKVLLSHWNLRDEIKANYNNSGSGLDKQQTLYEVMKRIINQDIPVEAINCGDYEWNPYTNELFRDGKASGKTPESDIRYRILLNNFKAISAMDRYTGNDAIERHFSGSMEVDVEDAEKLFRDFLSSPELMKAGKMVASRLGRSLRAFDIWYDGFKLRSALDEDVLSNITRGLYPDAGALKEDLPNILVKLGFVRDRAFEIAAKIEVDAARGSGHAWASSMRGQCSRLRTRIPEGGLDYKGYNIAIHEFGHNVEQTLSLYGMDYYTMSGVPNTAFTEALAFIFQQRDLDLLGIAGDDSELKRMLGLDKVWNMYEITGVSLLDIRTWQWLYANPSATEMQLKDNVMRLAKEIWNEYYAPVFGIRDEPVLAIYSHILSYPLYLSAYAYGQIIEFQLEDYLSGKDFGQEVERIFRLGRLTPEHWMIRATGKPLSVEPMLDVLKQF